MTIIIFMIIIVISIFFFRVLFIFVFLMFMVMIVSGEDVIAWDNVGVQVQEEIGSCCSIYSLCQEQKRTFHTHTHTPHPATTPIPPSSIPQQVMWANSRMLQVSGLPRCEGDMRDASETELQVKAFPSCKWDVCLALPRTSQRVLNQFGRIHLCSRCSASDDRRRRCSAFVCRGTWKLLSPPTPPKP